MDLPDAKRGCHRTGFAKRCRPLVVAGTCVRWVQIQGKNPNTGEDVNRSNCIDDWDFLLAMEHSQQQRQTGAAVESARNEAVNSAAAQLAATQEAATAQARAVEATLQTARAALAIAVQAAQQIGTHAQLNGAAPAQLTHAPQD